MPVRRLLIALVALAPLAAVGPSVQAAGRVRLELVGDARGAALAFQEWARLLSRAGVKNVRIRSGGATDKVGIEVRGTQDRPLYVVTGIVNSPDELILPSGRFRRRDVARLARWLEELAKHGPAGGGAEKSPFGLSAEQFEEVHEDLAQPVGFSTRGTARNEVVQKMSRRLLLPLRLDAEATRALGEDKVAEELLGLSCGTALACVLRPAGYCLLPRRLGQKTVYTVQKARPGLEIWPVGWEPDKPRRDVLPALFEFHNVNIQGVSAAVALEAIGKRLKVPVLLDHNAMARHGVDPAKALVSYPRGRTTYSLVLRKILFQAGLKFELRVDEAGNPFLWISTVKPV